MIIQRLFSSKEQKARRDLHDIKAGMLADSSEDKLGIYYKKLGRKKHKIENIKAKDELQEKTRRAGMNTYREVRKVKAQALKDKKNQDKIIENLNKKIHNLKKGGKIALATGGTIAAGVGAKKLIDKKKAKKEIEKEFTSKAFKLVKSRNIIKEANSPDKGLIRQISAGQRGKNLNLVAEKAVDLDRKLSKKGIIKSTEDLSKAATIGTHRKLARSGYVSSDIVPNSTMTKTGNYLRGSKDGNTVKQFKQLKKNDPKSATEIVNEKKAKKEIKKRPLLSF